MASKERVETDWKELLTGWFFTLAGWPLIFLVTYFFWANAGAEYAPGPGTWAGSTSWALNDANFRSVVPKAPMLVCHYLVTKDCSFRVVA